MEGATAYVCWQDNGGARKLVGTVFLLPNPGGCELAGPRKAAAAATADPDLADSTVARRVGLVAAATTAARTVDTTAVGPHYCG